MFSDGSITINYGSFKHAPEQLELIEYLKGELHNRVDLTAPEDYERRYPNYKIDQWSMKSEELFAVLDSMIEKFPLQENV